MHTLLDERDKLEIENQIQKISNNSIVSKKAGSSIVVNDSANNKPKGLRVFGKTEQKSYSGKNLFRLTIEDGAVLNGVTFTFNSDGSITLNGIPTKDMYSDIGVALLEGGVEYTISGCPVFDSWDKAGFYVNSDAYSGDVWNRTKESTFVMPDTKEYNCTIQLKKDLVLTNVMFYPMIRLSSITDDTYEPYVGGIASPNPNYPQELVSAGGDGDVEAGVYEKNLFDPDTIGYMSNITGDITIVTENLVAMSKYFPVSDVMTAIIKDYNSSDGNSFAYRVAWYDSDKKWIANALLNQSKTTLSIPANAKYFRASASYNDTLMICYGDADTYEPCVKQSLTIPTPNGLPGIPITDASLATYTDENGQMWCSDEVDMERNVYVQRVMKSKPIKTLVFRNRVEDGRCYLYEQPYPFGAMFKEGGVQSMSTIASWSNWGAGADGTFALSGEGIYYKDSTKTLEEVNAMFAELGTNFEVLGVLETPIETPLSEEELAQYKALTMNHPTTTILNDSNAHMEVSYVANTQNHIEQNYLTKDEFESLKTRISSIANNII